MVVSNRTADARTRRDAQLTVSSSALSFGSVQVGNPKILYETLRNSSQSSNITVSRAALTGAAFSMSGLQPPVVLTPGQGYTFSVTFTPPAAGKDSGKISISSDASDANLAISLSGTGTQPPPPPPPPPAGQLSVTPTTISFNNVTVGSYGTQTATLSASGANVVVSSIALSNPAFSAGGLSLPATVTVGQPVQFAVTFTPQAIGAVSGTISFTSNAANSPTAAALTGSGVAEAHVVDLSWSVSPSQNIAGYNVYRGNTSGGPYSKINSQLDPNNAYSDSSVSDTQTYYYVTTAVNSNGQESGYSNETQATIP